MGKRSLARFGVFLSYSLSRTYLVPLLFLLLGLACHVAFGIIGSHVAPDGTLIEPFFLLPIGYLLCALGIITGLIIRIRSG